MNRNEIKTKWDGLAPCERDAWVAEVVTKHTSLTTALNSDGSFGYRPKYTTDISAAWEITNEYDRYEVGNYSGNVTASLGNPGWYVTAETAPEAICLAALIAKLSEEEE